MLVTPTVTLPNPTLEGVTEICGWMPVPLNEITAGELAAVLTTLILPNAVPAAVGAKPAVSARLCPAARVTAPKNPVTLNPVPVAVTCEMLTLPVPVFFSVTLCTALVPVKWLPKLNDTGAAES